MLLLLVLQHLQLQYKLGKHCSNVLESVSKQVVIEVEGGTPICDGGGGALGHPLMYIELGNRADVEAAGHNENGYPCIYCGLKYCQKM